jgi:integration host factor subunit alpha
MALTKAQMVMANSKLNGFSLKQSSEIIETLLELIKKTLASGEDVLISNFGKFCVKEKKDAGTEENCNLQVFGNSEEKN